MKNKEIKKAFLKLNDCPEIKDMHIMYAIEKNKRTLENEIEVFDKIEKNQTPHIREQDIERIVLREK